MIILLIEALSIDQSLQLSISWIISSVFHKSESGSALRQFFFFHGAIDFYSFLLDKNWSLLLLGRIHNPKSDGLGSTGD